MSTDALFGEMERNPSAEPEQLPGFHDDNDSNEEQPEDGEEDDDGVIQTQK